jgi:fused signal recognition particle receptor
MLVYLSIIAQAIAIDLREEVLGFVVILCLLIFLLRIRKKRAASPFEAKKPSSESDSEISGEADILESEEIFDEEFESFHKTVEEPEFDEAIEPDETFGVEEAEPEIIHKEHLPPETKVSFIDRLKSGLSKTRQNFSKRFEGVLSGNRKIDEGVLEEIEEILITSDVGVPTTMELISRISQKSSAIKNFDDFKSHLKNEMLSFIDLPTAQPVFAKPHVIMIVGVNGVGKTTTIGKLAAQHVAEGKKVLLSASDTFRAAAVEQLQIWADRAGADIVRHRDNADPAAVAFDSIEAAMARGIDIVIVDTAGRLQTKVNLMEQLKKIKRSISKKLPDAPHEVLLVLDATTGQNALSQAKLFHEGIGITGIILAKLDGTAKGGIVLGICHSLKIPIRYIGIGEGIDDLQAFDAKLFIDALL